MKKQLPNFITLLNLLCGVVSIFSVFQGKVTLAAYLIFTGAVLDFFDGAAARLLKVHSELGKQLDSLADMVTFGTAPAFIAYALITSLSSSTEWLPYVAFIIPLFSALRLAKFNIDERQTSSFIGLPTPANGFFWAGIALMQGDYVKNPYLLAGFVLLFSLLLVSPLPMFSLKFKQMKWKGNALRYFFLCSACLLILLLSFTAIPIIILLYIIFSIVHHLSFKEE
jgi:CDP-diacylglycerol--serine O-phosphatidyltransferase